MHFKLSLEKLSLIGVAFLLVYFNFGFHLGWLLQPYDELRLFQLFFTLYLFLYLICNLNIRVHPLLAIFIIPLFYLNHLTIFGLQDFLILILLPVWVLAISQICRKISSHQIYFLNKLLFYLVCLSIISIFFLFFSIQTFLLDGEWHDWQMNFNSIRVYDSFIVPIFFILVYLKLIRFHHVISVYPVAIFLISLSLWFDGARSALISILIALSLLFLHKHIDRKVIVQTFIYIFLSFVFYSLIFYFHNQIHGLDQSLRIARTTSSGRSEIWSYVYEQWLEVPIRGLGGNYLATIDYPINHPHNFYLKLIFEWGLLGLIYLYWIGYQIIKVIFSQRVHIALKAGIVAIAIDACFSGSLVYPASQISIILLLGLAFSQYKPDAKLNNKHQRLSKMIIILWFGIYLFILISYFMQDLLCWQCGSYADLMAPAFWFYGKSHHLIHHSLIP